MTTTVQGKKPATETAHTPVLLHNILELLAVAPDDVILDGTVGGGGHAEALRKVLGPKGVYLALDRDSNALTRVRKRLGADARLHLICGNARDMSTHVHKAGFSQVNKILLDLGLSSDQLERSGRGFSFARDEPLLMTMSVQPKEGDLTAAHIVNEWAEESLADIIYGFGGERRSRAIARAIVSARDEAPIRTSQQLASLIEQMLGGKRRGIHPATRTFQALRIAVNDELGALTAALGAAIDLLAPNGRIAVISFHSLEDRIVKRTFATWQRDECGELLTKHPVTPSMLEVERNRRARSAKLRAFRKY